MTHTRKTVFELLDVYAISLEDIENLVNEDFHKVKELRALINKENYGVVFENGDKTKYHVRLQSVISEILWASSHLTSIIDSFYCIKANDIVVAYEQSERWK